MRKFSLRIRFFLCIICAFSTAAALGACGADKSHVSDAAVSSGPIAAYVGDQVIYEDQVSDYTTEFRAANGLEDDAKWKNYLASAGLTGKTWREDVIRQKADRMLIEQKAAELGINADQSFVEEQIAAARARSGVGDDDRECEAYLEAKGFTLESLIESYEYTSI